jgi:hypothetical protein
MRRFVSTLLNVEKTHLLRIRGENGSRYDISYTCLAETPASVEKMILDHVGCTNAMVFQEFTHYYEISVNKHLTRVYCKNFNVSLRFVKLTY